MRQITQRLQPGQDLKIEIERIVARKNIEAGFVASLVGSLQKTVLRVADGKTVKEWNAPMEIVSATGTISMQGCHIHIAVASQDGSVIGGHLKTGCLVNTTVEIVLIMFDDAKYKRVFDAATGYEELVCEPS